MNNPQRDRARVVTDSVRGVLVVRLSGDIDLATDPRDDVMPRLAGGPSAVVLDLRAVTFFGSRGVSLVVEAMRVTADLGVPLAVVADSRPVLRTLEVTDLTHVLTVCATDAEALTALSGTNLSSTDLSGTAPPDTADVAPEHVAAC